MSKGKKKKIEPSHDSEAALRSFAEVLLETIQKQDRESLEVFELYTNLLRTKIFTHQVDFPEKFVQGFKVICADK